MFRHGKNILSPDALNAGIGIVIAAPLTTGSRPAPSRVAVWFAGKDSLILPDQLRTLDKTRRVKKLGKVNAVTLTAVLRIFATCSRPDAISI